MKAVRTIAAIAMGLLAVAAMGPSARADFPPGKAAPAFTLQRFDGQSFSLADYKGKVVLLHFWEPNCSSCNEEVPTLEKLYKQFSEQGLQVVGVAEARLTTGEIPGFLKKYRTSYPIALDTDQQVGRTYRVAGHPTTVLVDREGTVRWVHNGWVRTNARTLAEAVQTILKGGKLAARE